ncbi:TPA: LysR family transcriptional regulator [Klebsiella aerogenes]|nr:LysR family transcriptional regulator [Klebsiella aerogenes]HCT8623766.1 LysR family transcriptional regulator [Klebsiella aerogenes]HCT8633641.1 LysR family transcriptional regulator [Klebsiella aerogenes]HCT8714151.1 LysR family transcriptional regulator [Klebsiella aerogenes]HDT2543402.1 LysR family transcriptional regulator [Klebsiella aerogenes]
MKNTKFDQKALAVIDAIIKYKTATAAASALNLSPGAIYYVLRKLRNETGKEFFTRTSKGLVPNDNALALHQKIKDRVLLNKDRKTFIITTFSPVELYIGLHFSLLQDCDFSLHFRRMPQLTEQRLDQLKNRFVDIDIGHHLPENSSIISYPCLTSKMCIMARKGHKTITGNFTTQDWYRNSHLIWLRGNEGVADMVANREQYSSIFSSRKIAAESANILSMALTCANSEHIMMIPEAFAPALKEMFAVNTYDLPWRLPLSFKSYIHVHRRNAENPRTEQLLRFLRDIFNEKKAAINHAAKTG